MIGKNVLIITKELITAFKIKRMLQSFCCYDIDIVSSGEVAFKYLIKKKPDVIILGLEQIGEIYDFTTINHINLINNIPFIYITSLSCKSNFETSKYSIPFRSIPKPIQLMNLYLIVEEALHMKGEY